MQLTNLQILVQRQTYSLNLRDLRQSTFDCNLLWIWYKYYIYSFTCPAMYCSCRRKVKGRLKQDPGDGSRWPYLILTIKPKRVRIYQNDTSFHCKLHTYNIMPVFPKGLGRVHERKRYFKLRFDAAFSAFRYKIP